VLSGRHVSACVRACVRGCVDAWHRHGRKRMKHFRAKHVLRHVGAERRAHDVARSVWGIHHKYLLLERAIAAMKCATCIPWLRVTACILAVDAGACRVEPCTPPVGGWGVECEVWRVQKRPVTASRWSPRPIRLASCASLTSAMGRNQSLNTVATM
jgi:hypothetical protein